MKIRKIKSTDVPAAFKLIMHGFNKYVVPTITKQGVNTFRKFNTLESMYERYKNPKTVMFVAEDKAKIIGYIEGNKNNLWRFFVKTNLIGKGIGKKLFTKFENFTKRKGGKFIHVNASLSSVEVYKKLGFTKTTGVRKKEGVIYQPMKKSFN